MSFRFVYEERKNFNFREMLGVKRFMINILMRIPFADRLYCGNTVPESAAGRYFKELLWPQPSQAYCPL